MVIQYRPLVWTADERPHLAVTRTLQYAADVASSRNGQLMTAKSLHRRWKHEIQVALLRRRAAMARAVLPNLSDDGPGDNDLDDSETDTAIPASYKISWW